MKINSIYILLACFISGISFSQDAIKVKIQGEGQPILFLPGFANSSQVWAETLDHIEGDYQFHLVDYAGFNGLEPIETPWLTKIKTALIEHIKTRDLKKLTIVGHSLGGTLALYLAAELPTHLDTIVVVDALANTAKLMFPDQEARSFSYNNPYAKYQLEMPNEDFEKMVAQQVQMMCINTNYHPSITKWILNTDRKTYVDGYIDYLNFDATPYLKKIQAKVFILAATSYGRTESEQVYKNQYANLVEYEIKFADNTAHYIMYDQPDWFYAEVNKILMNE